MGVIHKLPSRGHPGAFDFVLSTMTPENVALMSEKTSLIPTTADAAALTEQYKEGGQFRSFYEMANAFALVRPKRPAT